MMLIWCARNGVEMKIETNRLTMPDVCVNNALAEGVT
jgi:hypothetical protein